MTDSILLAHGSGGKLSHDLINQYFLRPLKNNTLEKMDDAAVINLSGKLAFTTDSYVVRPIFFPGGDIGKLAVYGTVNDLAMIGARPLYLSLACIIEEGLTIAELEAIIDSIKTAASRAEVQIVTGDTKVVNKGAADKIFINTAGIGIIPDGIEISGNMAKPGDKIILSGAVGDHGIAVLSQREGLEFSVPVISDCAPLNSITTQLLQVSQKIHAMRDPTRGGLATTLKEIALQSGVGIQIYEEQIPVHEGVRAACELLGLDPFYLANEGKLVAFVSPEDAESVLDTIRKNEYGREAKIIGEVTDENRGRVILKTRLGASRILDMLSGEMLPRIC